MSRIKKLLILLFILFISIQFWQPARNKGKIDLSKDLSNYFDVPENVYALLKNACYDCHSNNSKYPIYSYIQPLRCQIEYDIQNGKEKLNFNEFSSYSPRKRISKLRNIKKRILDDTMPLKSYQFMHKKAQLNREDKALIINWIEKTIE